MRHKEDIGNIIEELADVQIMIYQISELFDIDNKVLVSAIQCKLDAYKEKKESGSD